MGYLYTANSNGRISRQELDKKIKIINNEDGTINLKYSGMQKIKNSIKSTGNLITKGAVKETESQLDWMNKANSKLMSGAYKLLGRKDLAQREVERSNDFIKEDYTQKIWDKTGLQNNLEKQSINGSIIKENNIGGQIAYGLGQQGVRIAEGALLSGGANVGKVDGLDNLSKFEKIGVQLAIDTPSNVAMYASSYGSGYEQALQEGATTKQAEKYARGSAAIEFATEMMTGGIPGTNGKGFLDYGAEKVINKITQKASSKVANIALKYGYHIIGEGFEEAMSEILNPYLKNATYGSNEKIDWEQVWNAAVVGGVIGGILEAPGTVSELKYNKINKDKVSQNLEKNIDGIKENVNNNQNINNNNKNIEQIQNEIQRLEILEKNDNITNQQEQYLAELKKQLNAIQNQNVDTNISLSTRENLPTVQEVVNQEKLNQTNSVINLPINDNNTNANIEVSLKQRQNEIIQNSNPVNDAYHTWIRNVEDIKTLEETINDSDWIDYDEYNPDLSRQDIENAIDSGKITVYSSYPIKQGIFVSPSKMEAESYSNNGKVYSKEVNINDVAWIDPTQGQYAKVSSNILPVLDATSINNINKAILPTDNLQINQVKGNIPINQELLNKYNNVSEMINKNINKYDGKVDVKSSIAELNNIDLNSMSQNELSNLAINIFEKYNSSNTFINDGNKIMVTRSGIKESINKILYNKNQKQYLKEHLQVFSDLGDIIESATLASQTTEGKSRENNKIWNYYLNGLNINDNNYLFEFDVVSRQNGENHYRVQRLEKINSKKANASVENTITSVTPTLETSAFSNDNIPQSNNNVNNDILPTINNMQNSEKNTNKILNPNEISKLTKEDANTTPILPTRANINKVNDGDSHFAKNIKDKVNMLNAEQKAEILSKEDIRYYDKVTNKESLEKAFKRLNDGGKAEVTRWFNNNENIDSSDVAEGYILLKQYSDKAENAINLAEKDYYNEMVVETAKKMRKLGTIAGQTVQAFNIMERMTPEGMVKYAQSELSEAYDRMVKNKTKEWIDEHREDFDLKPDEVKFIMDTMKEIQDMDDGYDKRVKLAEIQKLMTDKLPPEKGAKIRSWMRISMLFNPKTQVRNVAGNALIMPVNSFSDLFSSYMDKLIAKKTGIRTTGTTNVKAMIRGIKRGAYEATNDYRMGINTKDMEGNRFEISNGKSFNDKIAMGKALNRTEALLNYVMDAGDRVFSEAAFENSLRNQLVLNNATEITQEMIDIAHQEALSRTWNDNNNYTRFVLGVRKGLNKLNVNGYGLGDVLIPFAKTPANLTKAIVDYSPAGLVSAINKGINLKRSLANGQYTATMQHEFVQSLGKATAGTMLYILGVALAKAGITSGDSDDDKDTANFLKNTLGINSYSIKIGDKSFTYDWAQPLAAPLSITANVVNSQKNDTQALLEGIIGSLDTAGSILLEQSFLQSINDVLNDNDGVVSGIINEVLELPARAVPTFSKQIADLVDGTQRTSFEYGKPIQSAVNSIKAKIPFVSKTLNPAVDTMGREIQKYGGKNNIFNVFLNPANVSTENISESAEEIYRLYKETGETDVMPRVAPYYINQKGEKIMMTGKDRVEYQKISGEIIEDNIKKLINNTSYSNMSDSDKANVVKDIVNYSYNIAKKDVLGLELSNTYQKAYKYSEIGDIGDYYTFKESIDNTDKDTKKASITKFLIDSNLNDKQLAYLYGNYYSSDKVLNALVQSNIPIKEYIKFNSETFESDYYANGKTVPNSRKNKVIKYINSLNLSIPQKAILIKMEYSSFKQYDNQIVKYVNNIDCSPYDKKVMLKTIGFTSYDNDIINTINSKNISVEEKTKELEELGFKVRNGRVYTK